MFPTSSKNIHQIVILDHNLPLGLGQINLNKYPFNVVYQILLTKYHFKYPFDAYRFLVPEIVYLS